MLIRVDDTLRECPDDLAKAFISACTLPNK